MLAPLRDVSRGLDNALLQRASDLVKVKTAPEAAVEHGVRLSPAAPASQIKDTTGSGGLVVICPWSLVFRCVNQPTSEYLSAVAAAIIGSYTTTA